MYVYTHTVYMCVYTDTYTYRARSYITKTLAWHTALPHAILVAI